MGDILGISLDSIGDELDHVVMELQPLVWHGRKATGFMFSSEYYWDVDSWDASTQCFDWGYEEAVFEQDEPGGIGTHGLDSEEGIKEFVEHYYANHCKYILSKMLKSSEKEGAVWLPNLEDAA